MGLLKVLFKVLALGGWGGGFRALGFCLVLLRLLRVLFVSGVGGLGL